MDDTNEDHVESASIVDKIVKEKKKDKNIQSIIIV